MKRKNNTTMTRKITILTMTFLVGLVMIPIGIHSASAALLTELHEDFESYNNGDQPSDFTHDFFIWQPKTPEINIHEIGTIDGDKTYHMMLSTIRETPDLGVNSLASIESLQIDPLTHLYSVDILGTTLRGDGGESDTGATILYGIVYDTTSGEKLVGVRTHATGDKSVAFILPDNGMKRSFVSSVILNDFTTIDTWKTFSGNVKSMYDDNGLGNYDSDVTSWSLVLGGSTYTSQINGQPNEWEGYYDNISITSSELTNTQAIGQTTILGTCGLSFPDGNSVNYGALIPNSIGSEIALNMTNSGTQSALLEIRGTDWEDGSNNSIMNVNQTHFNQTSNQNSFAQKALLNSTDGTVTNSFVPSEFVQLLLQLEAVLLDPLFTGSATQTMDFTVSC